MKQKGNFDKMSQIFNLFQKYEPEPFARVFCRAKALFKSFTPKEEIDSRIGRNRLQEIEKEIEEKRKRENEENLSKVTYNAKE